MMKYLKILFMGMIAIGLMTGTSFAAWTTSAGTQTVLVTSDTSQRNAVNTLADPIYTTVAGEVLAVNDTITITLTGGAVFGAVAPTLKPSVTVDLGSGVAAAAVPITGGTAGDTSATWRVVIGGGIVGVTYTLDTFTGATMDVTGVAAGANVDFVMTMATATGTAILAARSHYTDLALVYPFTGADSETVAVTAVTTDTADVAATTGAFTRFAAALPAVGVTGSALVLSFTNDSGAATLPVLTVVAANKVRFWISGNLQGITSISAAGCTGSDSAGSITGGTANFFLINTARTAAYCVNTAAVAAGATLALAPVFTLNGVTAQTARSFAVQVSVLVDGTNWTAHTARTVPTFYTINRNGASRYLYNIPGSSNSDQAYVRITNTADQAGKVYGTMYNQDGTLIGTASTEIITSLGANATQVFTAADLETLFGATWTGRARMDIDAELPSIEAMGLIRSVDGSIQNMSPVAP
ncbi:MAG: hypothetical protein WC560_07890 [Syntrophales bacterium]